MWSENKGKEMTGLREAAIGLLEAVMAAIEAGDWKVDGACDPHVEIIRLKNILARPEQEPVKEPFNSKAGVKEAFNLDRGCWERGCMAYDTRDCDEGVTVYVAPEVTPEVTPEVVRVVLALQEELSRTGLQQALDLKDEKHFRKAYLLPALASGLVDMTRPETPRSSKQRYRRTRLGQRWLETHQGNSAY